MAPIGIAVISASALTRAGLQQIVGQAGGRIELVGLYETFREAAAVLRERRVRVVIADDSQASVNLARELRWLMSLHPGVACLLILQRPAPSLLERMLRLGVRGLLHREDNLEETLNQAITMAALGSATISPRFTACLERAAALPADVSQRDLDMLQLLTEGLDAKEIAARLGVKYNVVNRALKKLQRLYDAQNLPHLAVLAHESRSKRPSDG
jgi:two-component system uhpT operon response regulator UhpA